MAKFCSQCGRPLKEGEVCDCKKEGAASGAEQRQPEQEDAFRQSQWDNSYRREKQSSEGRRLSTVSVGSEISECPGKSAKITDGLSAKRPGLSESGTGL